MVKDIPLVGDIAISSFNNDMHISYMLGSQKRVREFKETQPEDLPAPLVQQFTSFNTCLQQEDDCYQLAKRSEKTVLLQDADQLQDKYYRQARNLINVMAAADYDPEKQEAAKRLQFSLEKYKIDTSTAYEMEANDILQWLQEAMSATQPLSKDLQTLGLTGVIKNLYKASQDVLDIIHSRTDDRTEVAKQALRNARLATDVEYRLLVLVINAAALMDTTEKRFLPLVKAMNGDIDYYKNTILAHRKVTPRKKDDPEPEPETKQETEA